MQHNVKQWQLERRYKESLQKVSWIFFIFKKYDSENNMKIYFENVLLFQTMRWEAKTFVMKSANKLSNWISIVSDNESPPSRQKPRNLMLGFV